MTEEGKGVPRLTPHPASMVMTLFVGAASLCLTFARGGFPARPALRPRASALMVATSAPTASQGELWDERELWALEDAVPRYAVDAGRLVCWDRLALDVPELMSRSGEELRACWFDPPTALQKGKLENAAAECPPRLEEWEWLEDGSVRGVLYGVAGVRDGGIRATVAAVPAEVGCSMAEAEQWCVRTRDGDVYQLGRQIATSDDLAPNLGMPDALGLPDLDSVGDAATAAVRTLAPSLSPSP